MKNFLGDGETLHGLVAPTGGVVAGLGYVIGANTFVVAQETVAQTLPFVGKRTGIFRLPKSTSDALVQGAQAFWDNTTKLVRAASATGRFPIGVVTEARLAADTYGDIAINVPTTLVVP